MENKIYDCHSSNNYTFKMLLISILFLLNSIYLVFVEQSFYSFFANVFFGMLVLFFRSNKLDCLLTYTIGVFFVVIFFEYWSNFYGGSYFLGRMSDDWQYDVLWSYGYVEKYGFSPFYLVEHLNDIASNLGYLHNSKGYVYVVILFRGFGDLFDGYSTFVARIFNVYLLVVCASYAAKIIRQTVGRINVAPVIYAVTLFPVMMYTAVHVFRDILVASMILIYISNFLELKVSIKERHVLKLTSLLVMVLALVVVSSLRSSVVIMLVLLSLIAILPKKQLKLFSIIIAPIALFIFFNKFNDEAKEIMRLSADYDALNASRFGYVGRQIFELPKYLGVFPRISYLVLTPVPIFTSFHQFYTSLSAIMQVLFVPFLISSLMNKNIEGAIKVFFLGLFMAVAMSTATFRHVVMYVPLGIVLIFVQLQYTPFILNRAYLKKLILTIAFLVFSILFAIVL